MSKSRKAKQVRLAPPVYSMMNASMGRIQKLLTLCETRLNTVLPKADNPAELPNRDIQSLVRMIVTLQKEWDKYADIRYTREEILPSESIAVETTTVANTNDAAYASDEAEEFNKTTILLNDSISALTQNLNAPQVDTAIPALNRTVQKAHEKRQAKKQKFAHTFFQKQPLAATL